MPFSVVIINHPTDASRAGEGNRTLVSCLEGRRSTIELHPRHQTPAFLKPVPPPEVGNEGFEPSKARGQQIYSLSPLTAWVIPLFVFVAEPNLSTPRAPPCKATGKTSRESTRQPRPLRMRPTSEAKKGRASEGT